MRRGRVKFSKKAMMKVRMNQNIFFPKYLVYPFKPTPPVGG
jgi:hypothetical protein